ncbi:MAG: MFS transporter [Gammaproteobacteria bacterium]|nr:MFS transporter [Gammaproteobacteria bacterium]MDH4253430.1 MFS transporter [Gammaproteobacteria bacterium]MDH5309207.1 MFS transporter [Gammaproteobacteria bacterium]
MNVTASAFGADIDALFRRHRLRVMLAITLGYGFIYTCRLGLSIVKKPLIDGGIFTVEELGMIGAALFYGYASGKFINGFLSDYVPPRVFFSASIFLSALVNIFMGTSTLLWLSVTLWALNGFVQGMAAPSAVISITNWFSIHERGRCYGIWSASHSIGEGLTFYVIAAVVAALGWRAGFVTPGILCIAVAAWVYAFLRNAPQTMGLPDISTYKNEPSEAGKKQETWRTQRVIFGISAIWVIAIASALMYVTRYAVNSWGVLYLQEIRGYSLLDAGWFLAINTIAGIAGSIAFGFISDKLFDARRPPANLIFAIVEVLALLVIFYGPKNDLVLTLAFALYGAALSGLVASVGGLFAVDIAPRGATGAAMGFVGVFSYLGAAIQENVSASLISDNMQLVEDVRIYDFDAAIVFWIGTSVVSMLLAASLWNTKIRN